jgi:hypothetical protein
MSCTIYKINNVFYFHSNVNLLFAFFFDDDYYSKATPRRKPPTNEHVIAKFANAKFFN